MALAGLQGAHRRRRKGCTTGVEGVEPFGDLVGRDFRPDAPNRVWCADIKQIKTGEGWLYLAAVQNLFSRRIVGWAMDRHMRSELVVARWRWPSGRAGPRRARSITPTTAATRTQPVLATAVLAVNLSSEGDERGPACA